MKKLLALTLLIFCYTHYSIAQVPEPTILTMESINGNIFDEARSRVITTIEGGIIVIVETNSDNGDVLNLCSGSGWRTVFFKYNSDATQREWTKCIQARNDTLPEFLYPLSNGYFIVGSRISTKAVSMHCEDQNGDYIWGEKVYGGSAGEIFKDLIRTTDGGFLFLAGSNSSDGDVGKHYGGSLNNDMWVLKVDSNGNKLWSNVFGGSAGEEPIKVVEMPDDKGFYLAAYTYSNDFDCVDNHGNADLLIVRIDTAGNKIWSKCFGGSDHDGNHGASITLDGKYGLYISMHAKSADGDIGAPVDYQGIWQANIDSSENVLWAKTYGDKTAREYPGTICRSTDGTIWVGASSYRTSKIINNFYGQADASILHFDSNGVFLSSKTMGTGDADFFQFVHPLSNNLVFAGGSYRGGNGAGLPSKWQGATDVFLTKVAPWPVSIQGEHSEGILNVYPNPANSYFTIQHSTTPTQVQIFDVNGRCIYTNPTPKNTTKVNTDTWAKGVYLIWVSYPDGKQQKQTIVKQ